MMEECKSHQDITATGGAEPFHGQLLEIIKHSNIIELQLIPKLALTILQAVHRIMELNSEIKQVYQVLQLLIVIIIAD